MTSNKGVPSLFPGCRASSSPRQLRAQAADLHLLDRHSGLAADLRQLPLPLRLRPVGKRLLAPRRRAAAAMPWPDSTSRTASCWNSSVYLPRLPFASSYPFHYYSSSPWDTFWGARSHGLKDIDSSEPDPVDLLSAAGPPTPSGA